MKYLLLAAAVGFGLARPAPTLAQPAATITAPASDDLRFCGEQLPAYLPAVAQRWQKIIATRARYTDDLVAIQRKAAVLFPIIEPILKQYAVPGDLKYLTLVESELRAGATSRRGAAGIWQLMPKTARQLGLSLRRRHDQRYDVRIATQAACRYLWELYRQTGSWMLAASAYNAGPTYIARLTKQFPAEHPLMLPFAKAETQDYVYQAIAYKELLTRPDYYSDLLSDQTILAFSQRAGVVSATDRQTMLATLEKPHPETESETITEITPVVLTNAAVVVAGPGTQTVQLTNVRPVPTTQKAAVSESASRFWPSVQTRSLTKEAITEGQLFVFEVVGQQTIDGVTLGVGDLVYAHVEIVDQSSNRVYLRASRVVSAQTRESMPLKLVAVESSRKPGVPLPIRDALATGWRLAWEKL